MEGPKPEQRRKVVCFQHLNPNVRTLTNMNPNKKTNDHVTIPIDRGTMPSLLLYTYI